jgi:radical SAM-linked protein
MTMRAQYRKVGPAVYLSHLDVMRALERACRRAGLPLAYTEGFNPHPRLAFGPALGVGIASGAEFVDIDLEQALAPDDFRLRLNRQLPDGLELVAARALRRRRQSLSAAITVATYEVTVANVSDGCLQPAVATIMSASEWIIPRARTGQETDVRGLIHDLELLPGGPPARLMMVLATGPAGNLRPQEVLAGLARDCACGLDPETARVTRMGLFVRAQGRLVAPWET